MSNKAKPYTSREDRAKVDRDNIVRARLLSTIEKLDRIIVGRGNLEVKWDGNDNTIAFNSGGNIYLGSQHFKDVNDIDTVVAILGANYHEVAHLLFSPVAGSDFMGQIKDKDLLFRSFNYLEDARIEALFVARYDTSRKYFLSTFLDVMLKITDHRNMFVISHGRRFIPLDVRRELEEIFREANNVSDEDMEEFKRIINSYRRLSNRKFTKFGSAMRLVVEFSRLLSKYNIVQENSCSNAENSSPQDPELDAVLEARQVSFDTDNQDQKEEEGEDGSGTENEDKEESESKGGSGDNQGDEDGEDDDDWKSDGVGGKDKKKTIYDRAFEIKQLVKEDEKVRGQVEQIEVAIRSHTTEFHELPKTSGMIEVPVLGELKHVSSMVDKELARLYAELEGGWKYGADEGIVNIDRAMMPDTDPDEAYDKWDEGTQTDVGIEMVIMLDTSASMEGEKIKEAENSMWVLKRALDAIEARVTVISFDHITGMVYGPDESASLNKMYRMTDLGGNTLPAEGMQIARRRLNESAEPHKIFVIITDGSWGSYSTPGIEPIGTTLANMPGKNVYIGIGQECNPSYSRYFQINRVISNPVDVLSIVREMVTQILREAQR